MSHGITHVTHVLPGSIWEQWLAYAYWFYIITSARITAMVLYGINGSFHLSVHKTIPFQYLNILHALNVLIMIMLIYLDYLASFITFECVRSSIYPVYIQYRVLQAWHLGALPKPLPVSWLFPILHMIRVSHHHFLS